MTAMTIPAAAGPDNLADAKAPPAVLRKVLTASFIGNFVEWFDYASYGYFATIIAVVFFPEIAPSAALLATFAVFAISFIIRPIGGIVWGSIGDRIGRKTALSWSILIMSGATTLIAFLPGYAQIGFAAPILLLQGLDDLVVPPNQAEEMADAARAKGLPVALIMFAGEGHGFRRAETIVASYEAQVSFLAQVFGFIPADDVPVLAVENLP